MREIKFRAWFKDWDDDFKSHMWYQGDVSEVNRTMPRDEMLSITLEEGEYLMQYTGLKDKNGKEIYEGDIITSYMFHNNEPYIVELEDIFWQIGEGLIAEEYVEILGNIHENPELLK